MTASIIRKVATSIMIACAALDFTSSHAAPIPISECSDDFNNNDPYRVINTVYSESTQPGFMDLSFDSRQPYSNFDGIVTVNWHNLSNAQSGVFQLNRQAGKYKVAAVATGPGLVALQIIFANSLTGKINRTLPEAQCNATVNIPGSSYPQPNSQV